MNLDRTVLTLMMCAACVVRGDQTDRVVQVGGDVPKPGPVKVGGDGMTIDSAITGVGMDLEAFYAQGRRNNDELGCPIRVMVFRHGETTTYNPSVDAAAMRTRSLELNDTIAVMDFRQHPKKIEARRQRIERMIELASTEIADELLALATLQQEYAEWHDHAAADPNGYIKYLQKEATRLVDGGKGQKILDILDLKLSALQLEGRGHAHPAVKSTTDLIQIFRNLVAK